MYILTKIKNKNYKTKPINQPASLGVGIFSIQTEPNHLQYQVADVIMPLTHGVIRPNRLCSEVNNLEQKDYC